MLLWLSDNVEWLFSGLGIAIFGALITFIIRQVRNSVARLRPIILTNNDVEWNSFILPLIARCHISEALFIEYSSANIRPVLDALLPIKCQVRLLLRDPDAEQVTWRKRKIVSEVEKLLHDLSEPISGGKLQIKLYSCPGSIRLRHLADTLVATGCYTYDFRPPTKEKDQVWGHDNPMFTVRSKELSWGTMNDWGKTIFERMWEDARDIPKNAINKWHAD